MTAAGCSDNPTPEGELAICEFCPASGDGYCSDCQDTPAALEVLTPRHLHDVGVGSGVFGSSLPHTIARVQAEYGVLSEGQLEDLIQGWQAGSQDAAEYRRDMAAQVPLTDAERAEIPY